MKLPKPHNPAKTCSSLPVRGRGLKLRIGAGGRQKAVSPPVRGRGLKLAHPACSSARKMSPPVRGRGLKHD